MITGILSLIGGLLAAIVSVWKLCSSRANNPTTAANQTDQQEAKQEDIDAELTARAAAGDPAAIAVLRKRAQSL